MTKPHSIIIFDRLFLGGLVLGVLNFMFAWSDMSAKLTSSSEFAVTGFGTGFLIASFAIGMILNLIIWYFISAKASKIAKWILVVFFVFGLLSMLSNVNNPLGPKGFSLAVTLVITVIQGAAIYMLFRPDSVGWFNREPVDPDTFR